MIYKTKDGRRVRISKEAAQRIFDRLKRKNEKFKLEIKKKFFQVKSEDRPTRYIRGKYGGRLAGRYSGVPTIMSDRLRYLAMTQNVDLDRDGYTDIYRGQIIGRLKKGQRSPPEKVYITVDPKTLSGNNPEKRLSQRQHMARVRAKKKKMYYKRR